MPAEAARRIPGFDQMSPREQMAAQYKLTDEYQTFFINDPFRDMHDTQYGATAQKAGAGSNHDTIKAIRNMATYMFVKPSRILKTRSTDRILR